MPRPWRAASEGAAGASRRRVGRPSGTAAGVDGDGRGADGRPHRCWRRRRRHRRHSRRRRRRRGRPPHHEQTPTGAATHPPLPRRRRRPRRRQQHPVDGAGLITPAAEAGGAQVRRRDRRADGLQAGDRRVSDGAAYRVGRGRRRAKGDRGEDRGSGKRGGGLLAGGRDALWYKRAGMTRGAYKHLKRRIFWYSAPRKLFHERKFGGFHFCPRMGSVQHDVFVCDHITGGRARRPGAQRHVVPSQSRIARAHRPCDDTCTSRPTEPRQCTPRRKPPQTGVCMTSATRLYCSRSLSPVRCPPPTPLGWVGAAAGRRQRGHCRGHRWASSPCPAARPRPVPVGGGGGLAAPPVPARPPPPASLARGRARGGRCPPRRAPVAASGGGGVTPAPSTTGSSYLVALPSG